MEDQNEAEETPKEITCSGMLILPSLTQMFEQVQRGSKDDKS